MTKSAQTNPVPRVPVALLVIGLAVVVLYYLLRALDVGKIGDPTDIGGGLMAMAGYAVAGIGLVALVAVLIYRRAKG